MSFFTFGASPFFVSVGEERRMKEMGKEQEAKVTPENAQGITKEPGAPIKQKTTRRQKNKGKK